VVIVWLENREAPSVTPASMPYLTGLAATYGAATNYHAVSHPSLPNYLAFWSGSTQGVTDDRTHDLTGSSLSSQLSAAGISWRIYAQDYPNNGSCNTGATYRGSIDGWGLAGTYVRKHDPAMSFTSVSGSSAECRKIRPLAQFDPSISVSFVVPNLCNDAHDCPLATADAFLKAFSPQVLRSPEWASTLFVVTFDEGTTTTGGGGHVYAMVARAGLSHHRSAVAYTHYSLTRTIEDVFGVACLNRSCSANPLTDFLPQGP
jgi:phospholipase C